MLNFINGPLRLSIILCLLGSFSIVACSSSSKESPLSGVVSKHANAWLYLEQVKDNNVVPIDSAKTNEKGEFTFKQKIEVKDFYRLRISQNNFVFIVLDPKEKVRYENNNVLLQQDYTLSGSEEGKLVLEIKQLRQSINTHRDSLIQIINNAPAEQRGQLQKTMEEGYNQFVNSRLEKARNIIKTKTDKLAAVTAAEMLDQDADFESYALLAESLKKNYPKSGFAQNFINRVEQMKATAIGSMAPEINLPSPDGQNIALSSLRGKVVLIDFWASWCGPCRMENPNVVRLYNEVKDKGFEVYSVSLDKDKNAWVNAIQKDGLVWKSHVSDLQFWGSSVVKQYGFSGIPFTVLIDRDGKIIGKGLRGEQLEEAVKKQLP